MNVHHRVWKYLVAGCALLLAAAPGSGAELRTSAGNRPVYRTASHVPTSAHETIVEELGPVESYEGPWETGDAGCGGCSGCSRCCFTSCGFWADFDFLLGTRRGQRFPPLVTTSPFGTPANVAGVLGQAATTIAYPTEPVGEEARPGARISLGMWIDPAHCWALEGRYFALANERTNFNATADSDIGPILARPFFDGVLNQNSARQLSEVTLTDSGSVSVTTESEILGGDALVRRTMCRWGCGELALLVGYQYARLDESLVITDRINGDRLLANPNFSQSITDSFATRNEYHAAVIGAATRYDYGCWRLDLLGKIGLGNMSETVTISGQTVTLNPPGPPAIVNNGLLALGANLGTFSQDKFAVSPEINVKLVYLLSECVDVSVGYTFLYWSNVAQAGEQVDPDLRVPTNQFLIDESESWIHAFTLGASFQF
jgi:hypothetical protein